MNESYIQFDREKFKQVVHYICATCASEELGNVKLHKVLYFSDMLHFLSTGKPLTGVDYLKQRFGPTARHLSRALADLASEGKIRIDSSDYFGYEKKSYVSLAPPIHRLGNDELTLLHDVIEFVRGQSARAISELSHDDAWDAAEMGERIPYAAAYAMLPSELTDADMELATEEARKIRHHVELERNAGTLL